MENRIQQAQIELLQTAPPGTRSAVAVRARQTIISSVAGVLVSTLCMPLASPVLAGDEPTSNAPQTRQTDGSRIVQELVRLSRDPANWPMQGGNYGDWRYSPLEQINRGNVQDMRVAWEFSTGKLRGHEGGTLVIGDALYFQSPHPHCSPRICVAADTGGAWRDGGRGQAASRTEAVPRVRRARQPSLH
jgi:glucose dehydrogenase